MTADQIIEHFGGIARAAESLGFHRQSLYDWRKRGVPPKTQAWIQLETGGALIAAAKYLNKARPISNRRRSLDKKCPHCEVICNTSGYLQHIAVCKKKSKRA